MLLAMTLQGKTENESQIIDSELLTNGSFYGIDEE